jgi:RNA polymerase sigma factor (sigma-70 family)
VKIFSLGRVNSVERMTEAQPSWLIFECIAGNEAAIEMLVRQYETGVFRLALSIVGDLAEAYEEKKSFKAWLYTITLNYSRSHLRKRKIIGRLRATLSTIFQIETQKQASPEVSVIEKEKEAEVWKALNELDEPFRIVVVLRYFHELSIAEISEILSINEGTIHSRLHTARGRLRNALDHLHGE